MVLDALLEALVAFLAIDCAERALKIDDRGRLVADQSDETLPGMQTVGSRISANMRVYGARISRRLVDSDKRNARRVGALDVLQNGLIVPRNRDNAVNFLGDAGVDLGRLALSVLARDLFDQLDPKIRSGLSPEL